MPTAESGSLAEALIEYVRDNQDDYIESNPGTGEYRINRIKLDGDKKIVISYNETAEE